MEKVINWSNREELINLNGNIEGVARFMHEIAPSELEIDDNELFKSMGDLIMEKCQKITEIIGTYDEFFKASQAGEIE